MKKRIKVDRNKPVVHMSQREFQQTFDDIAAPLNAQILAEPFTSVVIALVNANNSIVSTVLDFGDGEGLGFAEERLTTRAERGLTLRRITIPQSLDAAAEIPLLVDAGPAVLEAVLVAVVRGESIVSVELEYGEGEGIRCAKDFVGECERSGLVKKGALALRRIPLPGTIMPNTAAKIALLNAA